MVENMIIEIISNWWDSKYLDREIMVDHAEILFVLVIVSFSIIITKIWIDERNTTKVQTK